MIILRRFTSLVVLPTLLALCQNGARAADPQSWALLVGVGDNIRPRFSLSGPKNDVPAVSDVLHGQYRIPSSHIRRLMNRQATRQNILAGWAWLAQNARPGDLVFFYYSGHGTVVPAQLAGSKERGPDSAICPFDAVSREGLIPGAEIGRRIDALRTDQVVVIVDACNSGHATRDIRTRRRVLNPTDFGMAAVHGSALPTTDPASEPAAPFAGANAPGTTPHKELYIGAARIDQSAIEGPYLDSVATASAPGTSGSASDAPVNPNMGALTFYLLQELRDGAAGGQDAPTYAELLRRIRGDLRKEYGDDAQEPQLSGPDAETTPFLTPRGATRSIARGNGGPAAVPVALALSAGGGQGATVKLRAVAGAALIPGSILQTGGDRRWTETEDAPTALSGTPSAAPPSGVGAGILRITSVSGATATGTVISGKVPSGFALTEVYQPAPDGRLRVAVSGTGAAADRLRAEAARVENITVVDAKKTSDVTLYPPAGVPTDKPSIVDVFRNGVALPSVAEADLPVALAEMQRVKKLADLRNDDSNPIHITVSLNGSEGFAKAKVGETVSYKISADRDAYITILDLTANGDVLGATRPGVLHAGETWSLEAIPVTAPAGLDTLKVIATTFPVSMDLPPNVDAVRTQGARGKAGAVARRVLEGLKIGSEASATGTKGLNLGNIATAASPDSLPVGGWACSEQLLRIDP